MGLMENIDNLNISANDQCSNIYLVDENLCLDKSYEIFNENFDSISTQFQVLDDYNNLFYNLFTNFSVVSSKWLNAYSNVSMMSASLNDAYSTMLNLSSFISKPFEITYPTLINLDVWYANINNYKDVILKNWLTINFSPITTYAKDQIIIVNLNLLKTVSYSFNFNRSFYESCDIYSSSKVQCKGCGIGSIKCNHPDKAGEKDIPGCNLCNNCNVQADNRSVTVSCGRISGGHNLKIDYNKTISDVFIPRNIKIKYKNINNVWTLTT